MEITNKQQGMLVVADVLDIIGGRWRGPILASLCDAPKRFNELKTVLKRITSSTLTKELRYLEELHLVERQVVSDAPLTVEYRLTEHGASIKHLIKSVIDWGQQHREVVLKANSGKRLPAER